MSDESPWDLEVAGGYWRRTRGIQEWVPLLVEEQVTPPDDEVRECGFGGCGVWFVQRKATQNYCSERCQKASYHARRRERDAA